MTAAELRRQAQKERARRARRKALAGDQLDTAKVCHPKQARLVDTLVLRRRRNVCCLAGRQSGKSHGGGALAPLLLLSRTPGVNAIVVTSTYASCKKMAFLPAVELNRQHNLGGDPNYGEMSIAFPNGSVVYYLGADNERTIERLRGTPNLILVVIDEAGIYSPDALASMIKAVRPGLRPRAGTLCVMGTPSRAGKQGTWYDITENPEYEQHRFDYRDNDRVPEFARVEELIDEDLRAEFPGLSAELARKTAWFLREYLALFEVDLSEKVYQLTNDNLVDDVGGPYELHYSTGDLGMSAHDSLVCGGWNEGSGRVTIVEQEQTSGQDTIAYADMVKAHNAKWKPLAIAVDPGALGQKTIKTVKRMHPTIPIEEATKGPIPLQVRALNELLQGAHGWKLYLKRGSPLALHLATHTWVDGIVGGEIDEHGVHSDLVPPARYLAIKIRTYLAEMLPPKTDAEAARDAYREMTARSERIAAASRHEASGYEGGEFSDDLSDDLYQD